MNFAQCFAYFRPPTIRWHAYKTLIFYFCFFFIFSAVGNSLSVPYCSCTDQPASLVISDRLSSPSRTHTHTYTHTTASSHWATEFAKSGFPNLYHVSRKRCRWTRCLRSVVCLWLLVAFQSNNLIHSNILLLSISPYTLISCQFRMDAPLLSSPSRLVQLRFFGIRVMASDCIRSLLTG